MGKAGLKRSMLAAVLVVGACAAPPTVPTPPPPQPPPPPVVAPPPTARSTPAPAPTHDRCGADQLQWLVGRPRTDIPVPLEPGRRRVLCTTCPITRENNVFRQTILFDAASGKVTSVACD